MRGDFIVKSTPVLYSTSANNNNRGGSFNRVCFDLLRSGLSEQHLAAGWFNLLINSSQFMYTF